ncbi:Cytosol aminopeptidase [Smittium culicis]|uniref:Cytosol aminopeptidase n=1 Tax=Smittium culicis TaxID=133412 RepID=A0A1R1YLK4_9FUNG|nr:Cytosol aminopeptidase [Smittium culicis]
MYSLIRSSKSVLLNANKSAIFPSYKSFKFSTLSALNSSKGLVLGINSNLEFSKCLDSNPMPISSISAACIIDELEIRDLKGKVGDCHIHYEKSDSGSIYRQIAVVGLGNSSDSLQEQNENIRTAVGTAVKSLKAQNVDSVDIEVMGNPSSAAEGAYLGLYKFDSCKSSAADKIKNNKPLQINPISTTSNSKDFTLSSDLANCWEKGKIYAESQNFARDLASTPANLMTPTIFANSVVDELSKFDNVTVNVYDQEWAKKQNMNLFLSVSQGSDEPLKFVEIIYRGKSSSQKNSNTSSADFAPDVALVGKGITFDSGGISIKPANKMDQMKGDMGGGASVVAAMRGISALKLPIDVVCVVPLCENMINGKATKPGDVFTAKNGKTVEILNTDAEGRLVLADALTYAVDTFNPKTVIDVATLTGAVVVAIGEVYSGVFSESEQLWNRIYESSLLTGDLVWRMPMHKAYLKAMDSQIADLGNISSGISGGGSSTAAMFLSQFLGTPKNSSSDASAKPDDSIKWAHMDIAGSSDTSMGSGYHFKGMTGRPTRTLIELLRSISENPL